MIFQVDVDFALDHRHQLAGFARYEIEAGDADEAALVAAQMMLAAEGHTYLGRALQFRPIGTTVLV